MPGAVLALCIWELLRRHAVQHRLGELPDALPAISHVCLATFFGIAEALRVNRPTTCTPPSP